MSVLPPDRTFVVLEAGVTNYGDPGLAHRQVDVAVEAGADAIKFQAWDTDELVSRKVAAELEPELGFDWHRRLEERRLPRAALRELQRYAQDRGLAFFATAHDIPSLHFIAGELNVPMLKVGSGEAANLPFLHEVGAVGKPVFISFGLQSDEEALRAVEALARAGAPEVVALHCVSVYPTAPDLAELGRLERLRDLLGVPVGLSDHSVGWHIPLAAVALGARAIEKHLTFDKADPRSLDNPGALEPDEFAAMVRHVRELEQALRPVPPGRLSEAIAASRAWATQAIVAARMLEPGAVIAAEDLAFKRPGLGGLPPARRSEVIGKRLLRRVELDEQIRPEDLAD